MNSAVVWIVVALGLGVPTLRRRSVAVASRIASAPVSLATPCTAAQRNRKSRFDARGNFGALPKPPWAGSNAS